MEKYSFRKKQTVRCDAETAIKNIKKGRRILVGSGCAEPQHLVGALMNHSSRFFDNEIVHLLTVGIAPYGDPKYKDSFCHNAFFIGANVRDAVSAGHADYTPVFLSEIPELFLSGRMPLHAVLVQVSPPDNNNMVSLGISVDILPAAISCADIVIAQMNKNMPQTCGRSRIPIDCIDYLIEADEPLSELPARKTNDVYAKIGHNIAKYIHDGDTLQLGIGSIPDAVLDNLKNKNDLGIHSEMISDGVISLYLHGNITNKKKGINEGVSIVSFVLGSKNLYNFVHNNRDFHFCPTEYVNDPFIVAQNHNMVSINSALQVDLTGQVCADSLGSMFYSGFGGQVDFVRGARRSKGGRSFIALPATAKNWKISRIVPALSEGAGVVTTRADVDFVVTEYGAAYLHGKTIRERGLALIQIAHPDFRDELLSCLKERHYVYLDQKTIKDDDSHVKAKIPYSKKFGDKMIYFRPLGPMDEKTVQDFFYSHKPETIYQRYLSLVESLPHAVAQERVSVDYNRDMALAGYDSPKPYAQMVCLGRYIRDDADHAELGIVVKEEYHGNGIGNFLTDFLLTSAREHGIKRMTAFTSHTNTAMMKILKKHGFSMQESREVDGYYAYLDMTGHPAKAAVEP